MSKWIRKGLLLSLLMVGLFLIYWFYLAKPSEFLADQILKKEINEKLEGFEVKTIQDQIYIDERRVFVPFISASNEYGVSHWLWANHEWKVIKIESSGEPLVWKVEENDPTSYVLTWNLHPADQINSLSIYLKNERYYSVSSGEHYYTPGVQMMKTIDSLQKSYHVMRMPKDWAYYLKKQADLSNQSRYKSFFSENPQVHFGWSAFNNKGERVFPEQSVNGSGYSAGYGAFHYVLIQDDSDLESIKE